MGEAANGPLGGGKEWAGQGDKQATKNGPPLREPPAILSAVLCVMPYQPRNALAAMSVR